MMRPVAGTIGTLLAAGAIAAAPSGVSTVAFTQEASRRPLRADDLYKLREVNDPQRSPDGAWVAYTVRTAITDTDKNNTDLWMTSWDGATHVQLTFGPESEHTPRWSPDGHHLAFLSSRQGAKKEDAAQLWVMSRSGGEAQRVTTLEANISGYAWAPDSKRLVLVAQDPDPEASPDTKDSEEKTRKPIVVDRYYFKEDVSGYLGVRRSHLYLFDLDSRKAEILTPGATDEAEPAWSPDGKSIAFVSKRGDTDVDRGHNWDLFVIDARPGTTARRLTTSLGEDNPPGSGAPAWSPDGRSIAYLQGGDPKYFAYDQPELAVIPARGGAPRVLTGSLDRPVYAPHWANDGSSLFVLVVDDRSEYVARIPAAGGTAEPLIRGPRVISAVSPGSDGQLAVLAATATEPAEVAALENGRLRPLSRQNERWLADVQLGTTEEFSSKSRDGTIVNGLLVKPSSFVKGRAYPTVLRIHGGPNGQDEHEFSFERELLAAHGYLVVAANYRGSNGRGRAFQQAIFADWGNKEVVDLLGAIDHVVALGIADPARLGIGGWSYGGILTNYAIATDQRFNAAISGAGSSNQISMYGTDEYIVQYESELGPPWRNPDLWIKVSYPFFHADRIRTPTLFMGGQNDFNVPLLGSEQMYQALRSLNVDTQLVIYPEQYHSLTVPSYKRDRLERYVAWYDKYLKTSNRSTTAGGGRR